MWPLLLTFRLQITFPRLDAHDDRGTLVWQYLLPKDVEGATGASNTDDDDGAASVQVTDGELLFTIDVESGVTDSSNSSIR